MIKNEEDQYVRLPKIFEFMNDREKPIASIVDIVEQATRANEAILNPGKTLPPETERAR